jgi:hypothetical protein
VLPRCGLRLADAAWGSDLGFRLARGDRPHVTYATDRKLGTTCRPVNNLRLGDGFDACEPSQLEIVYVRLEAISRLRTTVALTPSRRARLLGGRS